MTPEQRSAVEAYILFLGQQMELMQWHINLSDEVQEPDLDGNIMTAASVMRIPGRYLVTLRLGRNFFEEPKKEMQHFLVHEMAHLISMDLQDVIVESTLDSMTQTHHDSFLKVFRNSMELMTDQLAYAFCGLLDDDAHLQAIVDAGAIASTPSAG